MSATGANSPKLTFAQYKQLKQRRVVPHPIVTDEDAVIAYRQAVKDLTDAADRGVPMEQLKLLEQAVEQAEQAVREATVVLRLRALPKAAYAALKAEHPPTEADHAEVAETNGPSAKAQFHSDTFGPALVAACLIEPPVTLDEAVEMAADMNEAEWDALFTAAVLVNQTATPTAGLVFS